MTKALIEQPSMFDIYDGGALDAAFGALTSDREGDILGDVALGGLGPEQVGVGGFVNISRESTTMFMGTFAPASTPSGICGKCRAGHQRDGKMAA